MKMPTPKYPVNLRHQGIYLLPNLFTMAALFAGFYSVIQAMDGHFTSSAIAIFVAMVLDGIDGRVARLTRTQTAFGAEFDSLSDMVSFGVAPAVLSYEWMLRSFGKVGWVVAFIYCAGAALRLARFNTQLASADKRYFTGLPSPSAAALVAGLVWSSREFIGGPPPLLPVAVWSWVALGVTLLAGLSMVSNIKFYSFKELHMRKTVPFVALLLLMLFFGLTAVQPDVILFSLFALYTVSGYIFSLWRFLRRKKPSNHLVP
jgi:CDP-diacylglycerol--serine O-phosphatidyltransferase